MKVDRRISERSPFSKAVNYIVLGGPRRPLDVTAVKAEAIDLSNEGMRIKVDRRTFRQGDVIQIRIPVSDPKITVPVLSEVRWVKEEKSKNCKVGLTFLT